MLYNLLHNSFTTTLLDMGGKNARQMTRVPPPKRKDFRPAQPKKPRRSRRPLPRLPNELIATILRTRLQADFDEILNMLTDDSYHYDGLWETIHDKRRAYTAKLEKFANYMSLQTLTEYISELADCLVDDLVELKEDDMAQDQAPPGDEFWLWRLRFRRQRRLELSVGKVLMQDMKDVEASLMESVGANSDKRAAAGSSEGHAAPEPPKFRTWPKLVWCQP